MFWNLRNSWYTYSCHTQLIFMGSTIFLCKACTINLHLLYYAIRLFPLHNFGGFIFRNNITGVSTCRISPWYDRPGFREFRNFMRWYVSSSMLTTVSTDVYTISSHLKSFNAILLIGAIWSLFEVSMTSSLLRRLFVNLRRIWINFW